MIYFQGIEIYCKDDAPCSHIYLALRSEQERRELYHSIIEQKGTT